MPEPMPEPHLPAADADRTAVAEVLGRHMSTGRLTVAEYDERLGLAYAARTYGELAALTADLPAEAPAASPAPVTDPRPAPARLAGRGGPCWGHGWSSGWNGGWSGARTGSWSGSGGLRAAWASWLTTAVIVVGIWALTSVGSGEVGYPWPVWVIGPWGVVLLAQSLGGNGSAAGRRARDARERRDPGVSGALSGGQGGS